MNEVLPIGTISIRAPVDCRDQPHGFASSWMTTAESSSIHHGTTAAMAFWLVRVSVGTLSRMTAGNET